jgi:hypothetical protein
MIEVGSIWEDEIGIIIVEKILIDYIIIRYISIPQKNHLQEQYYTNKFLTQFKEVVYDS